ncbi:hypothetical protein GGI42DRAFT_165168 [Trichoderma sp. SZMC 28013]
MRRISPCDIPFSLSFVLWNSCDSCAPMMDYQMIRSVYQLLLHHLHWKILLVEFVQQNTKDSTPGDCITIIKSALSSRKRDPTPQLQAFWVVATVLYTGNHMNSYSAISTLGTQYRVTL